MESNIEQNKECYVEAETNVDEGAHSTKNLLANYESELKRVCNLLVIENIAEDCRKQDGTAEAFSKAIRKKEDDG